MVNKPGLISLRNIYFYGFFLLLLLFAISDYRTSANVSLEKDPVTGEVIVDRSSSHRQILLCVGWLIVGHIGYFTSKKLFFPAPLKLLILLTLWQLLVGVFSSAPLWTTFVQVGWMGFWCLTMSFFTKMVVLYPDSIKKIQFCILFLFVFNLIFFLEGHNQLSERERGLGAAYNVLVFLPWIPFLFRKSMMRYLLSIVIAYLVVLSLKRGALIALIAMIFASQITEMKITKSVKKIPAFFVMFLLLCLFVVLINTYTGGMFFDRFSKDEIESGSGRATLWSLTLETIWNSSFFELLCGHGNNASFDLFGTIAHNEWLEYLLCYGVIGVSILFAFYYLLIRRLKSLIDQSSYYAPAYAACVALLLTQTMVSTVMGTIVTTYSMALLGVMEGLYLKSTYRDIQDVPQSLQYD